MDNFDLIIIGFGKGGKTLAKYAATHGQSVAVIEQSKAMYGGTCINIGCIPSKTLVHDGVLGNQFSDAIQRKFNVVSALNNKNFHNLADEENITIFDNKAQFESNNEIALYDKDGNYQQTITGHHIVINTGATPVIPQIKGIESSQHIYDSTGIMNLTKQPEQLVIIGAGYIALEFASIFANFGTQVTVLNRHESILPNEDTEIVQAIEEDLDNNWIEIVHNVETTNLTDNEQGVTVSTTKGDFHADAVLVATGRQPNTDLNLEQTDVQLGSHGEIKVNERLRTDVPYIFAIGDVKGGPQFTYVSLDDFRIVRDQLFDTGKRTTANRGAIPYTMFIDPPLSRVGLTAEHARQEGYEILENRLPVKAIPRHKINNDARGLFKVVANKETGHILGASLYGLQSEELINMVKLAIDQNLTYDVLRDNIYTHPTMSESFNDLFNL